MKYTTTNIVTGTVIAIAGLLVTYFGTEVTGVVFITWAALPIATIGGILAGYGAIRAIKPTAPRVAQGGVALVFGFGLFLASTLVYSAYTDADVVLHSSVYKVGLALNVAIVGCIETVLLLGSFIDSKYRSVDGTTTSTDER